MALAKENPHESARRRVLCRLPFPPSLGVVEAKMTPAEYTGRVQCFREHKDSSFLRLKLGKTGFKQSIKNQSIKDDARRLNDVNVYE